MIDLENINDMDFKELVDSARKQIRYLSDEWTNTQESDPGMTLVDLFAWLKILQHERMKIVSDSSQYRFLQLLGISRMWNRGSRTLLKILNAKENLVIPKGTKWYADDMVFENEFVESVISSSIKSVELNKQLTKINVPYVSFDGKRIFYLFGDYIDDADEKSFKINFDTPIPEETEFNLYFDIFLEDKYKRNPINDSDDFIEIANISWEFYGTVGEKTGWYKLEVIADETHNFLFSGSIKFKMNGNMQNDNDVFSIRARLISQKYDFLPRITNILTNVFEVTQKSTFCENNQFKKKDISVEGMVKVRTNLAIYGEYIVYAKFNKKWRSIKDYTFERDIINGELRVVVGEDIIKNFSNENPDEDVLMIVAYDESIKDIMVLGSGTGMSGQECKINKRNILYDDFEIMVSCEEFGDIAFKKWKKVNDFYASSKHSGDYILDCNRSKILFGDNEFGDAPEKIDNNIVLIGFATTLGEGSNINPGMINKVASKNPNIRKFEIEQINSAAGGRNAETFEDMKIRALNILNSGKKAVTIEDYENIAKDTPGLIRGGIKILPSYLTNNEEIKNQNCVTIVVRGPGQRNICLDGYKENIKHYINKYKLINTKINVIGPIYIGLNISGQIIVNSYYRKSSNIVEDNIRNFVEKINEDCGSMFSYGDLFGIIDRLDCVSYIDTLSIDPVGEYEEKILSDNIIIPPNGVYYIENIDLNYISSADID